MRVVSPGAEDQARSDTKTAQDWIMGAAMLGIFFIADSYTSTIQEGLYQEQGMTPTSKQSKHQSKDSATTPTVNGSA